MVYPFVRGHSLTFSHTSRAILSKLPGWLVPLAKPVSQPICLSQLPKQPPCFSISIPPVPQRYCDGLNSFRRYGTESVQSTDQSNAQEASVSKCLVSGDSWYTTSMHMCFSCKEVSYSVLRVECLYFSFQGRENLYALAKVTLTLF